MEDSHSSIWEHRQAELWDRIFQVIQDVVTLADSLEDDAGGVIVKQEMVKTAMAVGTHLVRANAAEEPGDFDRHLTEARMKAIETDYWLRLAYVLQQKEEVQRDLSSIITQYAGIVDLLHKFIRHTRTEKNVINRHTKGPRIQ
ncbi:MAG: four helix bundle protein [Candidatus Andersenbacteria bacterium]|nr:four helix bundle protein [bacterium]MDZ4225608.1 four helix bundle protein [Candidatus Andersenbacteria bacterium]